MNRRYRFAIALMCVVGLPACYSYQRLGDRMYDEGKCGEALEYYDRAFEEGHEAPDTYLRAARCSLKAGDFSAAEKNYNFALRKGAGLDVAKEFADFYIRTSNYTSAVQVYQYLLYYENDKQPVYNNLGTALMYAERPFDAESYLMVAQQMDPRDPRPYVNLGVLYDRHLKQPWLAINFYDCFAEIAPDAEGVNLVRQRSSELKARWSRLYDPDALSCGSAFEPPAATPIADLKARVEQEVSIDDIPERPLDTPPGDMPTDGDGSQVVIDRLVTDEDIVTTPSPETTKDAPVSDEDQLALARRAYEAKDWPETISRLSDVPIGKFQNVHFEMMGMAYLEQNNWGRSKHWLELAVEGEEKPPTVKALIIAHRKSGNDLRVRALCKKYGNLPEYDTMVKGVCTVEKPRDSNSAPR